MEVICLFFLLSEPYGYYITFPSFHLTIQFVDLLFLFLAISQVLLSKDKVGMTLMRLTTTRK